MSTASSESTLFIPVDALIKHCPGAFWLRNLDDVARLTKRKRVWGIGSSTRLKETMRDVLDEIRKASESFRMTTFSLAPDKLDDTAKFLSRIGATRLADNILFLLEEDYGPAYNRLCTILSGHVPVLLPTGLCMPAGPGLSWTPEHVGVAVAETDEDLGAFLEKKRVMICNAAGQYASAIQPALRELSRQFFITGMIDPDTSRAGQRYQGLEVFSPEKLRRGGYDCLIATRFFFEKSKSLLYSLPPDNTPLVLLGSTETITRAAEVVLCHPLFAGPDGILATCKARDEQGLFRRHYHRLYPPAEGRSEKHREELAETTYQWMFEGRAITAVDTSGEMVNTVKGMRRTTDQPDKFDNAIYTFGKSNIYGNYNEDRETIASCLQRLCKLQYEHGGLARRFVVYNKGLSGTDLKNVLRQIHDTPLCDGDIITLGITPEMYTVESLALLKRMQQTARERASTFAVFLHPSPFFLENPSEHEMEIIYFRAQQYGDPYYMERMQSLYPTGNAAFRDALAAQGIPAYDLMPYFQRPHGMGEVFADTFHTVARGNERIAAVMHDAFVRNAVPVDVSDVDDAILRDLISIVRKSARSNLSIDNWLDKVPRFPAVGGQTVGAVVVNCNPFTRGHRHVIEEALKQAAFLYVFVVQEDKSDFSFAERFAMVQEGLSDLGGRVLVVPSGKFIISASSFPEYFSKEHISYTPDVSFEILLFGTVIAPCLGIGVRFFGEEPFCQVTRSYHEQLEELLPRCGVRCRSVPRLEEGGLCISASQVRALLQEGKMEEVKNLVPESTFARLKAKAQGR